MKRVAICLSVFACGCASRTLPEADVVRTEGTVSAAAAIGAARSTRSSEELEFAKQGIELAKKLARDGSAREARLVLRGAQADAELALMMARAAKARTEAEEATRNGEEVSGESPSSRVP